MTWRIRRSSPPEASSAARSKSGGTCQSMRNVDPGQGWMSTCRPGFHSRVEVEPPLGLPVGQVGADVADEEVVVERLARRSVSPSIARMSSARGPAAGHGVRAADRRPVRRR